MDHDEKDELLGKRQEPKQPDPGRFLRDAQRLGFDPQDIKRLKRIYRDTVSAYDDGEI